MIRVHLRQVPGTYVCNILQRATCSTLISQPQIARLRFPSLQSWPFHWVRASLPKHYQHRYGLTITVVRPMWFLRAWVPHKYLYTYSLSLIRKASPATSRYRASNDMTEHLDSVREHLSSASESHGQERCSGRSNTVFGTVFSRDLSPFLAHDSRLSLFQRAREGAGRRAGGKCS